MRGYVEEFAELKIQPGDFFLGKIYKDANNQKRPRYDVTKKGCEFIAHKLTGIKGTEFTARYINRFHDMEDTIWEGIPQQRPSKPKKENRASVNMTAKIIESVFTKAGVNGLYIAAEVKRIYGEAGYEINIPLITDKAKMPKLYDNTEMAKELGVYSTAGNPHSQAIGAILKKLHIDESKIVTTAFSRNGHDDVTIQYKPSVFEDVKLWLAENGYPTKISYMDSKGNPKTCTVVYREVA